MLEVLTAIDIFTGCGALAMPRHLEALSITSVTTNARLILTHN